MRSSVFATYDDGVRGYHANKVLEDQRREEQNAIFAHPSVMWADRSERGEMVDRLLAGRPKKKNYKTIFKEFSRIFAFGKVANKYENERYLVRKAWDAKVPKQKRVKGVRMEIPSAPMPTHLLIAPKLEMAPDEERKLASSRLVSNL